MSETTTPDPAEQKLLAWRDAKPTLIEWLCLAAGIALILRYAFLVEDSFVYFRYVDNLVFLGRGLVFNPGEYVEGYSSPVWILALIPLRALGLNFWFIINGLGIATFLAFWLLLVQISRRLSPAETRQFNLPLVYLCTNYAVLTYFTSGLEAPFVQLCGVAYAAFLLMPRSVPLILLVSLSPIVRHELALPFMLLMGWVAVRDKKVPWMTLGLCFAFTASWVLFRVIYYADIFPNTFHLKDDTHWRRGVAYVHDTLSTYWFYAFAGVGCASAIALRVFDRSRPALRLADRIVMLGLAASVTLYVVKIGGDFRHYRYLAFPFCLAATAGGGLIERIPGALKFRANRGPLPLETGVGLAFACLSFSLYPSMISQHPVLPGGEARIVGDLLGRGYLVQHFNLKSYLVPETDRLKQYKAYRASSAEGDEPRVSYMNVNAIMYRRYDYRFIHSLGLTDAVLAHVETEGLPLPEALRGIPRFVAHKWPLVPLAHDLWEIQSAVSPGPGMYERAAESDQVPAWVKANMDSLRLIEKKIYNDHSLGENLKLALTPIARIRIAPPAEPPRS